jgi:SAM-dependent methyltransferase
MGELISAEAETGAGADARERQRVIEAYARRQHDASRYSPLRLGQLFFLQSAERHLVGMLARHGVTSLGDKRILEVGCGTGRWLRQLIQWGATPSRLAGVDLLAGRLEAARSLTAGGVRYHEGSAGALPFADGAFDLLLQATVFTSVLDDALRARIAGEMLRVLTPGGAILWYDFCVDNPRNADVRAVNGREIARLFPECRVDLRRVTLAPPIARWLAPKTWWLTSLLESVPPLCTHHVGLIQKRARRPAA